jgi:hypothetical protein
MDSFTQADQWQEHPPTDAGIGGSPKDWQATGQRI